MQSVRNIIGFYKHRISIYIMRTWSKQKTYSRIVERTLSHWAIPPLETVCSSKSICEGMCQQENGPTRKWANNMCLYTRDDVICHDNLCIYIYIGVCVLSMWHDIRWYDIIMWMKVSYDMIMIREGYANDMLMIWSCYDNHMVVICQWYEDDVMMIRWLIMMPWWFVPPILTAIQWTCQPTVCLLQWTAVERQPQGEPRKIQATLVIQW